jgi:hypothetical protein
MKTTVIVTEKKEIELKEEYFHEGSLLSNEQAREICNMKPVLIKVFRDIDLLGKFKRTIAVKTKVYSNYLDYMWVKNAVLLDNDSNDWIERKFDSIEEAEKWVSEQIEKVKQNRQKILERIEQNKKYEKEEVFIFA